MPSTSRMAGAPLSPQTAASGSRKRKMDTGINYYAVRVGRKPDIYTHYPDCRKQIDGYPKAEFRKFTSYEEAKRYLRGYDPPSDKPIRYYGVAVGRRTGVFTSWPEAHEAVKGTKGPKYRKFETRAEAEAFVRQHSNVNDSTVTKLEEDDEEEEEIFKVVEDEDGIKTEESHYFEPPTKRAKHSTSDASTISIVYTDGSSLGNGKKGSAAGIGVYFGPGDARNVSEPLGEGLQTNQRAELKAIQRTLETVSKQQPLEIRTDSKYSIDCVESWASGWERNNWKTKDGKDVKNQDIIKPIRALMRERNANGVQTIFQWVKGHASSAGNQAADYLAVEGAKKAKLLQMM